KELVKLCTEGCVVGRDGGQHSRMIESRIQRLFEFADPGNDFRLEQRVQVAAVLGFLLQRIETPQQLHVLLGKKGRIVVGKNLDQGNFEGRQRKGTVEPKAATLPLSRHPRVAVKKCGDQVGLVAVYVAGVFLASEIAQNGFSDFGVCIGSERTAQHGRRDGLVEQTQPAAHAVERRVDLAITFLQRNGLEAGRNRNFASNGILQELLIEALHRGQDGQLPFGVLYHAVTPADLSLR